MTVTLDMVCQITIEACQPDALQGCLHNLKVDLNDNRSTVKQISFKSLGELVACFRDTEKVRCSGDGHNFHAIPANRDNAETILSNLFYERYVRPKWSI